MKSSRTIYFLMLLLAVLVIAWWLWSVIFVGRTKHQKADINLIGAEQKLTELRLQRSNYNIVKDTHKQKSVDFDTLKTHIPVKDKLRGDLSYINTVEVIRQTAEKHSVAIQNFAPVLDNTYPKNMNLRGKKIERYMVHLECNGDYLSIGRFLEDLTRLKQTVNVTKYSIETEYSEAGGLFCEIKLYTYVFIEN